MCRQRGAYGRHNLVRLRLVEDQRRRNGEHVSEPRYRVGIASYDYAVRANSLLDLRGLGLR